MPGECTVLKENIQIEDVKRTDLTTDCHFVHRKDGQVDVARGNLVGIFDDYYDRKVLLNKIEVAGGTLNPKLNEPQL